MTDEELNELIRSVKDDVPRDGVSDFLRKEPVPEPDGEASVSVAEAMTDFTPAKKTDTDSQTAVTDIMTDYVRAEEDKEPSVSVEETITDFTVREEAVPQTTPAENLAAMLSFERKLDRQFALEEAQYPSFTRLRLALMFFACLKLFGVPIDIAGLADPMLGFVSLSFYILSGFLLLADVPERQEKLRRTAKRSGIAFFVMLAVTFLIDIFVYRTGDVSILPALKAKRMWFNVFVLNVWPFTFGGAIWFVQGYFYAAVILYLLDRWKLLNSRAFRTALLIICLLLTVLSGETAGLLRFSFFGNNYVPGNFVTRALPYMLIGGILRRHVEALRAVSKWVWRGLVIAGMGLIVLEIYVLGRLGVPGYYGHLVGMGVMAVGVCMCAVCKKEKGLAANGTFADIQPRDVAAIYYLCQPVQLGLVALFGNLMPRFFGFAAAFFGILTYVICLAIVTAASRLRAAKAQQPAETGAHETEQKISS